MSDMTSDLRIFQPYPGVYAYYDGRIEGRKLCPVSPNWLDDAAYGLGTASYAIVDGDEALVYDTHITLDHARAVRSHLEGLGVTSMVVVLSHWHTDHVAGNEVFADCDMIALQLTADTLDANREHLASRMPPISPLIMPNQMFETRLDIMVGERHVELHHFDIHSADGNVLWLPDEQILLAADTLEDTVTYMAEPENTATHLRELARMRTWPIHRILPNHGDPDRIAAGGYEVSFIDATISYLERLTASIDQPDLETISLKEFVAPEIASGALVYYPAYEAVHQTNIASLREALRD